MSHGPFGLGGAAPVCAAIANVAPISVSGSTNVSTRLILVFMLILGIWNSHGSGDVTQVDRSGMAMSKPRPVLMAPLRMRSQLSLRLDLPLLPGHNPYHPHSWPGRHL